jgi:hypothetical protein
MLTCQTARAYFYIHHELFNSLCVPLSSFCARIIQIEVLCSYHYLLKTHLAPGQLRIDDVAGNLNPDFL